MTDERLMAVTTPQTQPLANVTKQIEIIHLSDVHFGGSHRFDPPKTAAGDRPKREGYPTLLDKVLEDLGGASTGCPVIVCITGDLATTASIDEFEQAEALIRGIDRATILGSKSSVANVFIVPGNHDVIYDRPDLGQRWQPWTEFWNRMKGSSVKREDPWNFVELHDRADDLGAFVLCLNSAIYVEKGKPDQDRGHLDVRQLQAVEDKLGAVKAEKLKSAIRIALIHHHPVLIPALSEPGRGYDAVHNSGKLLTILRKYGFHLVLHGHKHNPFTFSDDNQSAFQTCSRQPILIVSGGSVGSTSLPENPNACNCYNRITVKWHAEASQTRILVRTRGLTVFNPDGTERLPNQWKWKPLQYDDRHFFTGQALPAPKARQIGVFDSKTCGDGESKRQGEYSKARGNMPVVEVMPSLIPGQAYEARVWIVGHRRKVKDVPVRVIWSCGAKFETVTVTKEEDDNFCAVFNYWGSMLVQAQLEFEDGKSECIHVYARIPTDYSRG